MFKRLSQFFLDVIQVIVFSVSIFLFIYLLVLQPHKIKGASMMPNFPDGEYLLTDKVTYRFQEPKRGDVIVFEAPTGTNGEEFIKRIIALPGEEVSIKDSRVYINGQLLEEPYIEENIQTRSGNFLDEGEVLTVPENQYFVLGDNRSHSSDSRSWGFIEKDVITGRAWLVYWPIDSVGTISSPNYSF